MWGISIRSRTQLRIFRNAFRGKSSKDKCENYKENFEYYVSIKRRISKRLRNICNWLRNIQNLFLVFENLLFLYFQRKKKELATLPQLPHTQILQPNKQSTPQLSNLKRTTKHLRGIEPRSSCTTHFTLSSRPSFPLVETCIIV